MSIASSNKNNRTKVICHVPTGNQFENIKPIEVKCFSDEQKINTETEQAPTDVTATMMTIVPQRKRPVSAATTKKQLVKPVIDMVVAKPIRHLAILPSSKEPPTKANLPTDLSETFTMYDGPATTPVMTRSLDETRTMNNENSISDTKCEFPVHIDEQHFCNDTTVSTVCELIDQSKLQPKPHSLIGRYQPPRSVHIATVHYGESQPPELASKQVLIQQFYDQLEKMKATFNVEQTEPSPQLATNTLTFDNDGQVKQSTATNQLKEKTIIKRIASATPPPNTKKPPLPKKQRIIIKNPSNRIQSAPVKMVTQTQRIRTITNPLPSSCKSRREEKCSVQEKKSLPMKDKPIVRRIESAPSNAIEIHRTEVTLLPHEEDECRKMFEKLQRLQPNGTCADLNTLRRALYPPVGSTAYASNVSNLQTPSAPFKSSRPRTEEMPQSWIKIDDKYVSQYVPKQAPSSTAMIPLENNNLDRIADQMRKHAAINYSYYTRTK